MTADGIMIGAVTVTVSIAALISVGGIIRGIFGKNYDIQDTPRWVLGFKTIVVLAIIIAAVLVIGTTLSGLGEFIIKLLS